MVQTKNITQNSHWKTSRMKRKSLPNGSPRTTKLRAKLVPSLACSSSQLAKSLASRPKSKEPKEAAPEAPAVTTKPIIESIMSICDVLMQHTINHETYGVCPDTTFDDVIFGRSEGACLVNLTEDAMKILRGTPGLAGHAKWLKSQCEQNGKLSS